MFEVSSDDFRETIDLVMELNLEAFYQIRMQRGSFCMLRVDPTKLS